MKAQFSTVILLFVSAAGSACGLDKGGSVTAPSVSDSSAAPVVGVSATPLPAADPKPEFSVTGPSGCVNFADLGESVFWGVENAPLNAVIAKGYHYDDTPGCEATLQGQRTQNNHLRATQVGSNIGIAYDTAAYACRGRVQVDVDVNGVGVVRLVITNPNGPVCKAPKPEPEPPTFAPPTPEPPTEPPPVLPVCEKVTSWENHRFNVADPNRPIRAVATVHNGVPGTRWALTLYADGLAVQSDDQVVGCENQNLRVEVDWRRFVDRNWWTTLSRDGVVVDTSAKVVKP